MVNFKTTILLGSLASYATAIPINDLQNTDVGTRSLNDAFNMADVYARDGSDKHEVFTRSVQLKHEALQRRAGEKKKSKGRKSSGNQGGGGGGSSQQQGTIQGGYFDGWTADQVRRYYEEHPETPQEYSPFNPSTPQPSGGGSSTTSSSAPGYGPETQHYTDATHYGAHAATYGFNSDALPQDQDMQPNELVQHQAVTEGGWAGSHGASSYGNSAYGNPPIDRNPRHQDDRYSDETGHDAQASGSSHGADSTDHPRNNPPANRQGGY